MLVKLNTSNFTLENIQLKTVKKTREAHTKADWVKLDRIVMVFLFLTAIVGSLLF